MKKTTMIKNCNRKYVHKVIDALDRSNKNHSWIDSCVGGYRIKIFSLEDHFNEGMYRSTAPEAFDKFAQNEIKKMEEWVKKQKFKFPVSVAIRGKNYHISLIVPVYQEHFHNET